MSVCVHMLSLLRVNETDSLLCTKESILIQRQQWQNMMLFHVGNISNAK